MTISLEAARALIAVAQAEATKINKPMTVAVVDTSGFIVAVDRMDGARPLTPSIATAKAYTAGVMQRPSKMLKQWAETQPAFFNQVATMGHQPIVATDGGVPIKKDDVLLGGIGVSGGTGEEDQQVCEAALTAMGYQLVFAEWNKIRRN
ncbi:GlcG/HbpS family heme-binding protein [Burkholderia multivorans]|uniref:GlcG/HbpS family heme-binding protein n=1 Tax=Burkholderia multivorans TaxID=87883 RepID=UPI002ED03C34|nr:heme-binding protein [Burkholderia multivorans]